MLAVEHPLISVWKTTLLLGSAVCGSGSACLRTAKPSELEPNVAALTPHPVKVAGQGLLEPFLKMLIISFARWPLKRLVKASLFSAVSDNEADSFQTDWQKTADLRCKIANSLK